MVHCLQWLSLCGWIYPKLKDVAMLVLCSLCFFCPKMSESVTIGLTVKD